MVLCLIGKKKGDRDSWYFRVVSSLQKSMEWKPVANLLYQNVLVHVHFLEWNKVYCNQKALVTSLSSQPNHSKFGRSSVQKHKIYSLKRVSFSNDQVISGTSSGKWLAIICMHHKHFCNRKSRYLFLPNMK